MGKYGAFKRNFDFSGLSPLEAQKMLGYVELMNQCMDRARIAANNAVGNYQNYYCCYEQKMEADLTLANYLLSHIDEAVAKGWIKVYYQPIVDTFSSKISTYEALARWIDPNYGFLNPGEFIEVLERGHLIHKLDLHILDLAETVPVMVFLDKGGDFDIIYANKASKIWTESLRLKGEDYAAAIKEEFCALLRQLVSQTDGEIIEKSFRIKDYAGRLQLVAEMPGQRAYVISTNMV